ncbi:GNAT family N-acetyltransferase [Deinococcus cellulosilyticus]|uniref:N-acetyltransferase n=1 Tax=Deinococcus cellulosilyticus (strain DSM 18568 / NBRC 106333 / KACC 11606 / 5516J-15) TaxID=1223518 RepID=A0A511MVA5_DEIC1|nr:GNAT family N-acetyltransferase [Deinococcus cellulosilyticus]GEM44514.1 N-acetyltransferase [Deinococcus cellulosilyticus NBRC 106333 = KACC 11606]
MSQISSTHILLRAVEPSDLDPFFDHQRDPEACHMAAFTRANPGDRQAFDAHWQKILHDPDIDNWTIEHAGQVVGHVSSFVYDSEREITYWIDRAHWGKGLATSALQTYLKQQPRRPLYARAAADNHGSRRVLEKCGFQVIGEDQGFAEARGQEIPEFIFRLD